MENIVLANQSAFIKGRQLVDGVIAINEIIDLARKCCKECLIFKVDFEKSYDSVSLSFVGYMMRSFGFGLWWREWIWACVFTRSLSVLVNGFPTQEINIDKGLKLGDPLAPLFVSIGG
jgi:hypothetical protein